jgi:hypothetical protein
MGAFVVSHRAVVAGLGGLSPPLVTWLIKHTGSDLMPGYYVSPPGSSPS